MDLKPWQCGLCEFRSMLRPEVVDHCAEVHGCKMQYKCFYCAFRTSTLENATKHRSKFHPESGDETFYVYYREGAVPDEPDGTPRWRHQRLRTTPPSARVKTEAEDGTEPRSAPAPVALSSPTAPVAPAAPDPPDAPDTPDAPVAPPVNLNIVKREPETDGGGDEALDLYESFGHPCEPAAGLRYQCPLCSDVADESRERMQSHLYEELQCRKWGCVFCSYKAFHKAGLAGHMATEHRRARDAIELPVDPRIEMWITKVLDYQFLAIEKNRINASTRPSAPDPTSAPDPAATSTSASTSDPDPASTSASDPASTSAPDLVPDSVVAPHATDDANDYNLEDLEKSFGKFGAPENGNFSCPKCGAIFKEEKAMREHLEIELNKIRWSCSGCPDKFQNYHEAQFHCKTAHAQHDARILEAPRDAALRAAWLAAVISSQARSVHPAYSPRADRDPPPDDNSLLEVRYEEHVAPPPELRAPPPPPVRDSDSDDDDDKLVIDEPATASTPSPPPPPLPPLPPDAHLCPYCVEVVSGLKEFRMHVTRHDDIKPYFCAHCDYNGHRKSVLNHLRDLHKDLPIRMLTRNQRAIGPPLATRAKMVCLHCQTSLSANEAPRHRHQGAAPALARAGDMVVKCCLCLSLHTDLEVLTAHHDATHPGAALNYVYHKLLHPKKNLFCVHCMRQFKYLHHLRAHTEAAHGDFAPNPAASKRPLAASAPAPAAEHPPPTPQRRCARKSTTKLPSQAVAKKSTAKLCAHGGLESQAEEYSFYGTRPRLQGLAGVTTRLRLGAAEVAVSLRQLREVMSVSPVVHVRDLVRRSPEPDPHPAPP